MSCGFFYLTGFISYANISAVLRIPQKGGTVMALATQKGKKKEVKWSCRECGSEGCVSYDPPGNPYLVGYQAYVAHSDSPGCRNLSLNFDPNRLPKN